jgi:ankyrin repeat protein
MVAVRQGSDFVQALLEKKVDSDSKDSEGKTPLIQAVILDYGAVVETLLENNANPTILTSLLGLSSR